MLPLAMLTWNLTVRIYEFMQIYQELYHIMIVLCGSTPAMKLLSLEKNFANLRYVNCYWNVTEWD